MKNIAIAEVLTPYRFAVVAVHDRDGIPFLAGFKHKSGPVYFVCSACGKVHIHDRPSGSPFADRLKHQTGKCPADARCRFSGYHIFVVTDPRKAGI